MNDWNDTQDQELVDTDLLDSLDETSPGDLAADRPRGIEVQTRDESRGGETPRKAIINSREYPVLDVLERSRVRRADQSGDEEHYKVMLDVYGEAHIVYHHSWDGWTLEEKKSKKSFTDIFLERG